MSIIIEFVSHIVYKTNIYHNWENIPVVLKYCTFIASKALDAQLSNLTICLIISVNMRSWLYLNLNPSSIPCTMRKLT